jgi:hypothetical protein
MSTQHGLRPKVDRDYFNIMLGAIRKKCDPGYTNAESRTTKEGVVIHELVYEAVNGVLMEVRFREDSEYGNKWSLVLNVNGSEMWVSMPESSRYASDLLRKLPNMHRGWDYDFKPFDFEKNGERRMGLSIKDGYTDEKIQSYYTSYTPSTDKAEKGVLSCLHGYPEYTGESGDKEELKIYFMRVTKFLRVKGLEYVTGAFGHLIIQPMPDVMPASAPTVEAAALDQPEDHQLPF